MKAKMISAVFVVLLAACSKNTPPLATRITDAQVLARGAEVYRKNCASCHGDRAQGPFNWQKPGADGKYPPPPLDGSAHAWHHPQASLALTIRQGTQLQGGNMPGWGGKLSEDEIQAVIAWFQSTWSDEIFRIWADIDQRARAKQGG